MCSACRLMMFNICVKFHENMSSSFKVMERTWKLLTDTDTHRKDKNNIPPWHTNMAYFVCQGYKKVPIHCCVDRESLPTVRWQSQALNSRPSGDFLHHNWATLTTNHRPSLHGYALKRPMCLMMAINILDYAIRWHHTAHWQRHNHVC